MNVMVVCGACHKQIVGDYPLPRNHYEYTGTCQACMRSSIRVYECKCTHQAKPTPEPAPAPPVEQLCDLAEPSAVNHPAHYNAGGIETIEVIASMGLPVLDGFCRGNATKYIMRGPHKGSYAEDLRKAAWYLEYLAAAVESAEESSR
jgi:hypothetical protein